MAEIQWPAEAEIQSTNIRVTYPGRVVVRAEFSNEFNTLDKRAGVWAGTATIAQVNRKTVEERAIRRFLAEWQSRPKDYSLLPWDVDQIFSLASVGLPANTFDNNVAAANIVSVAGVDQVRLACPDPAGAAVWNLTAGEMGALNGHTVVLTSVTAVAGTVGANRRCDATFAPQVPGLAAGNSVKGRKFLPVRLVPSSAIDMQSGPDDMAGPWVVSVVEEYVA